MRISQSHEEVVRRGPGYIECLLTAAVIGLVMVAILPDLAEKMILPISRDLAAWLAR